jgi:hypothetical protein
MEVARLDGCSGLEGTFPGTTGEEMGAAGLDGTFPETTGDDAGTFGPEGCTG